MISVMVMVVTAWLTQRQISVISSVSSYFVLRKLKALKIRKLLLFLHISMFAASLILSSSTLGRLSKLETKI